MCKPTDGLSAESLCNNLVISTAQLIQLPEGPNEKGPAMVLENLFMVSQPNVRVQDQSWLHESKWYVTP